MQEDSTGENFFHDYEITQDVLGFGSFSTCQRCIHKATGEARAVKVISKFKGTPHREARILRRCQGHPNIVKLIDVYEDDLHVYIVMELLQGGELLERIKKKRRFTERHACMLFRKLLSAVEYIHSMQIVHRDIKPENLLLVSDSDDAELKLCDFGFAREKQTSLPMQTPCYTAGYAAPEVLSQHTGAGSVGGSTTSTGSTTNSLGYDISCDLWSLGVILYCMLCGYPPFYTRRTDVSSTSMLERIKEGSFTFPEEQWGSVSAEAKDLVKGLLTVDAKARLTAQQAINHPWVTGNSVAPSALSGSLATLASPAILRSEDTVSDMRKRTSSAVAETLEVFQFNTRQGVRLLSDLTDAALVKRRKMRHDTDGTDAGDGEAAAAAAAPHTASAVSFASSAAAATAPAPVLPSSSAASSSAPSAPPPAAVSSALPKTRKGKAKRQ